MLDFIVLVFGVIIGILIGFQIGGEFILWRYRVHKQQGDLALWLGKVGVEKQKEV